MCGVLDQPAVPMASRRPVWPHGMDKVDVPLQAFLRRIAVRVSMMLARLDFIAGSPGWTQGFQQPDRECCTFRNATAHRLVGDREDCFLDWQRMLRLADIRKRTKRHTTSFSRQRPPNPLYDRDLAIKMSMPGARAIGRDGAFGICRCPAATT